MKAMLTGVGICLTTGSAAWLVWVSLRSKPATRLPFTGWAGLAAIGLLEALLACHIAWIATFFTALVWTAYLFAADGAVRRLRGFSYLQFPARTLALGLTSIPIWLLFEAYNFRLRNWTYTGVPHNGWWFLLGANWAFATILPGIFFTAELLYAGQFQSRQCRPWHLSAGWRCAVAALGLALVAVPLLLPFSRGAYLFGLVWAGFFLLLDPINDRMGWPSLLSDLRLGRPGRALALLSSGLICGFFWEFWNFWAAARWQYVFPIAQSWKVFAMPLPGYLGFPPFALECFALWIFFSRLLLPKAVETEVGSLTLAESSPIPVKTLQW